MRFKNRNSIPVIQALLAAVLFGLNAPFSKILLGALPPIFIAALLYMGAGLGMTVVYLSGMRLKKTQREAGLVKKDLPWVLLMIALDIAAPFLLLWGLTLTNAANASILYNFELVATSFIAYVFFKEEIGRRLWLAMGIITLASLFLTVDILSFAEFRFSLGSALVLCACICWGLENNCTRRLSLRDPVQIVMIKGYGSGTGALVIAFLTGGIQSVHFLNISSALILGFVCYGLSIFFYVKAQRFLGAARTSMYYAAAPFAGAALSMVLLKETPELMFYIGTLIMAAGVAIVLLEKHMHTHRHETITHTHLHCHSDGHHEHSHENSAMEENEHTHAHVHAETTHTHEHRPDIHHRHAHRHS